jgi:hypothetical protein
MPLDLKSKQLRAKILPKSFSLENSDTIKKFFPKMFVTAMTEMLCMEVTSMRNNGNETLVGTTEYAEMDTKISMVNTTTRNDFGGEVAIKSGSKMDTDNNIEVVCLTENVDNKTSIKDAVTNSIQHSYSTKLELNNKATPPKYSSEYIDCIYKKRGDMGDIFISKKRIKLQAGKGKPTSYEKCQGGGLDQMSSYLSRL